MPCYAERSSEHGGGEEKKVCGARCRAAVSAAPFRAGDMRRHGARSSAPGEAHLRVWAKEGIIRELLESVAIAVQRGTALSYLHGYEQALRMLRLTEGDAEEQSAAARRRSGWKRKHQSRASAAAGAA